MIKTIHQLFARLPMRITVLRSRLQNGHRVLRVCDFYFYSCNECVTDAQSVPHVLPGSDSPSTHGQFDSELTITTKGIQQYLSTGVEKDVGKRESQVSRGPRSEYADVEASKCCESFRRSWKSRRTCSMRRRYCSSSPKSRKCE